MIESMSKALTVEDLQREAALFARTESAHEEPALFGGRFICRLFLGFSSVQMEHGALQRELAIQSVCLTRPGCNRFGVL